jgi:hypothetical protein
VLVEGRMADQIPSRRTPQGGRRHAEPAAAVLLAECVVAALLAVAVGLASCPAIRSTCRRSKRQPPRARGRADAQRVQALAAAARATRRLPWLIALSAGLPVPLLLGIAGCCAAAAPRPARDSQYRDLRSAGSSPRRRPSRSRRSALDVGPCSRPPTEPGVAGDHDHAPRLAAVNAIVVTWATARPDAVARAHELRLL